MEGVVVLERIISQVNKSLSTMNGKESSMPINGKLPNLKLGKTHKRSQDEEYNLDTKISSSPGSQMEGMRKVNYGRPTYSRREGSRRLVKKSSSGIRNIKNTKNLSVDVREYFNDGK